MVIEGVTQKRHPNLFPTKSQQLSMLIFPGFLPHSSWKMPKKCLVHLKGGCWKNHLPWLEYHWPPRAALHSWGTVKQLLQ